MEKIDLKSEHKELYRAAARIKEVRADKGVFLAVDGKGEPGGELYQQAINMLYSLAYTTKFQLRNDGVLDFGVCNLECLWFDDPATKPISEWRWRLLVRIPEQVKARDLASARKVIKERKDLDVSAVQRIELTEGRAIQVLHVGPYDRISETYQKLVEHARSNGLALKGTGHEVYLNDPRRTAPEKLKTIVRMPVKRE